jgi:hypothetical protein
MNSCIDSKRPRQVDTPLTWCYTPLVCLPPQQTCFPEQIAHPRASAPPLTRWRLVFQDYPILAPLWSAVNRMLGMTPVTLRTYQASPRLFHVKQVSQNSQEAPSEAICAPEPPPDSHHPPTTLDQG